MSWRLEQVWVVYKDSGERDLGTPGWVFSNEDKAHEVSKGRGWYEQKAPVVMRMAFVNDAGVTHLLEVIPETIILDQGPEDQLRIKQEALAKLTEEERRILGI